jgi:hypothetical protein
MKKVMFLMAVAGMMLAFASCEKDEIFENSSTITPTSTRTDVKWLFARDTMWAIFTNGDTLPTQQVTSTPKIRAERIYKEEGTNGIAPTANLEATFVNNIATSFPYNYGINNEVYVNQYVTLTVGGVTYENVPAAETLKVRGWHTVDNVASAPFHEQSHTTYTLLNGQGEVVIIDNDSISCQQLFAVREVLPTVVHDTTVVVIHDTVVETRTIVVYDTVIDGRWVTRWEARTRVAIHHSHTATTATDSYNPTNHTYVVKCLNRTDSVFTERLYIEYNDNTMDSSMVHSWTTSFPWYKEWSRTVTLNGSNPGSGRANVVSNTANFGGGNSVAFSNPTITTTPVAGMENATDCGDVLVYVTAVSNGVNVRTVVRHGNSADSTEGFIPWNGTTPPTPPTIVRIDTTWGNCTTANNGVYNPYTEVVSFVVNKQYRLDTVYSDNTHGHSVWMTASATYQYMVSRTGQPTVGMINNLPISISSDNTASFGGGAFTETLTPVGTQRFCPLTLTSAVLTSNGTMWTGSYGTSTPTVTITEQWGTTPPIFTSVLAAAATDTYSHQIFSQASYRTTYVCVVAQVGTNYRFYWAELAPGLVRTDFDSVSITSAEANFYVNHLSDGYYPAMVCDHNNHTTLYRGVVSSIELGTGWQQTYRLAPSNSLAYVMGGSSWTMAGDNGRSAVRGVMNASGQIVADGVTVQLY